MKAWSAYAFVTLACLGLGAPMAAAQDTYFPPPLPGGSAPCLGCSGLSSHEVDWYSRQLRAAKEPSLFQASQGPNPATVKILRLSILPSFSPSLFVLIEQTASGTYRMTVTELTGKGGYEPGEIAHQVVRDLRPEERTRLEAMLKRTKLVEPPRSTAYRPAVIMDGTQYVIEAVGPDGYRYLDATSPQSGPAFEVSTFLRALSGY